MEDTSISLGEYARQLRAQKQKSLLPSHPQRHRPARKS